MVNHDEIADPKIISQEFLKAARLLRSLHLGAFKLRGPSFPAVAASRTSPDLIPRTLSLCQVSSRRHQARWEHFNEATKPHIIVYDIRQIGARNNKYGPFFLQVPKLYG